MFRPVSGNTTDGRPSKRRKVSLEESDDEFGGGQSVEGSVAEDGMLSLCLLGPP